MLTLLYTEPLFLSCSEVDALFPVESRRKAVDMLIEDKKDYYLQLFGKVDHGFALRGNEEDPYERKLFLSCCGSRCDGSVGFMIACGYRFTDDSTGWVKEQSLRGIADWFDLWLGQ